MRVEDPNAPFRPINGVSVTAMPFVAPELLDSLRSDGLVPMTRATDIYSTGCFADEVHSLSICLQGDRASPIL